MEIGFGKIEVYFYEMFDELLLDLWRPSVSLDIDFMYKSLFSI